MVSPAGQPVLRSTGCEMCEKPHAQAENTGVQPGFMSAAIISCKRIWSTARFCPITGEDQDLRVFARRQDLLSPSSTRLISIIPQSRRHL